MSKAKRKGRQGRVRDRYQILTLTIYVQIYVHRRFYLDFGEILDADAYH